LASPHRLARCLERYLIACCPLCERAIETSPSEGLRGKCETISSAIAAQHGKLEEPMRDMTGRRGWLVHGIVGCIKHILLSIVIQSACRAMIDTGDAKWRCFAFGRQFFHAVNLGLCGGLLCLGLHPLVLRHGHRGSCRFFLPHFAICRIK